MLMATATKLSLCRVLQMRVLASCPNGLQSDTNALDIFRNLCVRERELEQRLAVETNGSSLTELNALVFNEDDLKEGE